MKTYTDSHGRKWFIKKLGSFKVGGDSFLYNIMKKREDFSSDAETMTADGLYIICDTMIGKNLKEAVSLSEFAGFLSKVNGPLTN